MIHGETQEYRLAFNDMVSRSGEPPLQTVISEIEKHLPGDLPYGGLWCNELEKALSEHRQLQRRYESLLEQSEKLSRNYGALLAEVRLMEMKRAGADNA